MTLVMHAQHNASRSHTNQTQNTQDNRGRSKADGCANCVLGQQGNKASDASSYGRPAASLPCMLQALLTSISSSFVGTCSADAL